MATREFTLTEIKKGNNICWFLASQSYYRSTIHLYDDKGKEYFKLHKDTRSADFHVVGHILGSVRSDHRPCTILHGNEVDLQASGLRQVG